MPTGSETGSEDGESSGALSRLRRAVRSSLPTIESGTCAGIRVPGPAEPRKPLDRLRGLDTPEQSSFEGALAAVHREYTGPGDEVVVVGGGFGITTAVAAEAGASVTVYEADPERLEAIRETLALNGVDPETVTLRQSVVGELTDAEAEQKGIDASIAPTVPPAELPPCDVLELDCEGAERAILRGIDEADRPLPRVVAVEVHPIKLGDAPGEVVELLEGMGYEPVRWLTHDGEEVTRAQFEGLLDGETPDVTGEDHQEFPPVVVARR